MVATFRVYKKTAPNGKLTLYLGKRDFVDHLSHVDLIDGVTIVDKDYLKNRKVFGQVIATFRYGREEDEVMGLHFFKELYLVSEQIYPLPDESKGSTLTNLQERLLKKLGPNAFPFQFQISSNAPNSVTLQPASDESGAPCGVSYDIKIFVGDSIEDKSHKRSTLKMGIQKIQWAPTTPGQQPCSIIRKDFLLSPGELELEVTLERQVFHHNNPIVVNMFVRNFCNKTVKRIRVSAVQNIDICMFASGHYRVTVACIDTQEGCPINPGSTLQKVVELCPCLEYNRGKRGVACEGQLKKVDSRLASTTLLADQEQRDVFGIVVSYSIKVKLFLGALGGEVVAEFSRENTVDADNQLSDGGDDLVFQDFARVRLNPGMEDEVKSSVVSLA
ncbi:arrestin homolog [Limulus polyphemus]|uniref:Arrestin homolog n=1 Tax=Limulus polyphemus TaxID=6850 RepID=A0ABM1SF27_LIMPO|nr:arrestin homolog [Limulus polyphemus]